MEKRVTIRDIAAQAGYHFTTVSLALRKHPSIPESTREKIIKVAEELNYRPDPMLSALMAYRKSTRPTSYTATLAWVTALAKPHDWQKVAMYRLYHEGARKRADELGYRLENFWLAEPGMSPRRARNILQTRNIQGLLLHPQLDANTELEFDWDSFSAVSFGYTLAKPSLHLVANHHFRSMVLLMREIYRRGYRRIGQVQLEGLDERVEHSWMAGFWIEQRTHPKEDRVPPLFMKSWDKERFAEWYRKHRPDAIVTQIRPIMKKLSEMGVGVPKEVGVAFHSIHDDESKYSGMRENAGLVGAAAVDLLVGMLHRNERGVPHHPQRILIEGSWAEGETLLRKKRTRKRSTKAKAKAK